MTEEKNDPPSYFWFKLIMTSYSKSFYINIHWTLEEFLNNVKPKIINHFNSVLQTPYGIEIVNIDILDNVHLNGYPENSLNVKCILPENITFKERYKNQMNNLAFYVRIVNE
jgi:hypothetical protein